MGAASIAALGLLAAGVAMSLPWPDDGPLEFVLRPGTLACMALAGATIALLPGWLPGCAPSVRVAMLIQGVATLAYPTWLGLAAAGIGGPIVMFVAMTGHAVPLTLTSLLPIIGVAVVTGRRRRAWAATVLVLAALSVLGLGLPVLPTLAIAGSLAWLASFAVPMVATWPRVRGTTGQTRRRAIVCGLASVVPVVIITFCYTLGAAEEVLRLGNFAVTALMLGFSTCTLSTAALVWGAVQERETWFLRTRVILVVLAGALAAVTVIVAVGCGLIVTMFGGTGTVALLCGVGLTAVVGLGAVRLYGWAARQVDPHAELADELARLVEVGRYGHLLVPAVIEERVRREAARADAAAAEERRRLSRDLHDGLQGRLLGITLNLQLSGGQLEDPAARLLVTETVDALRTAIEEVRSLGDGRVPTTLADGGLALAVDALVRPLTSVDELRLPSRRFPPDLEAAAYFVVCEAVANAVKHAEADHVRVAVDDAGDALRITVSDDGVGGADPRLGSGLRSVAERVSASGGLLTVRDGAPAGTVVEATLPCGS